MRVRVCVCFWILFLEGIMKKERNPFILLGPLPLQRIVAHKWMFVMISKAIVQTDWVCRLFAYAPQSVVYIPYMYVYRTISTHMSRDICFSCFLYKSHLRDSRSLNYSELCCEIYFLYKTYGIVHKYVFHICFRYIHILLYL